MTTLMDLEQTKSIFKGTKSDGSPDIAQERYLFVNSNMAGFLDFDPNGILVFPTDFDPGTVFSFLEAVGRSENRVAAYYLSHDIAFYSANGMTLYFDNVLHYDDNDDTTEYKVTYRNGEGETSKEQEYFDNRDKNTLAGPVMMAVSTTEMSLSSAKEEKILSLISDIVVPSKSEVNFTTNPLNQTLQKNISFSTESVLGTQLDESSFSVTITEGTEIETPAPTTSTTDLTTSTGTGTASPSAGTAISGYGGRSAAVGSSGGSYS